MTPVYIYTGRLEGKEWAVNHADIEFCLDYPNCEQCQSVLDETPKIECSPSLVQGLKPGDAILKECREQKWYDEENYCRILLVPVEAKQEQGEERRVLLLTSYCGDNPDCTNNHPCYECLQMCNVAVIKESAIEHVLGGFNFVKHITRYE